MDIAVLSLRIVLAAVFLVAGLAKLADLAGSQHALRDFGVPGTFAKLFGLVLPLTELAVAIALLPSTSAWWGAVAALVLLLLFVAGIGYNLARGRTPDCHCFGQLHSEPVGWPTLIRNLVLAALAGVVVEFGRTTAGFDIGSWLGTLALVQRIELIGTLVVVTVLVGEGWLLFHMLRQQGRLLLRIEAVEGHLTDAGFAPLADSVGESGLAVGTQAPTFGLSSLQGELFTLDALRARGKPVLLLFSDPTCGPCTAIWPEVGRWQRDYASKLTLVVISLGTSQANRSKMSEYGITHLLLQKDREVAQAYQAAATPSAVLIDAAGNIGSSLAQGADAIRALVASAIGLPALKMIPMAAQRNGNGASAMLRQPVPLKIGDVAPEFSLPDLAGNLIRLSDLRGSKTLVLFWRPGCGFCQRMLPDLKAWEAELPEGKPRLLVVSSEGVESNQAMELRSLVVLDQAGMSVGSQFGATGTPMAVLIDAEGKIASELAAGAPAVLALAKQDTAVRS